MTTVAVGIRFEREVWARHSAAAQARGIPLGTYLRKLLDEREQVATALGELRASLERGVGNQEGNSAPPTSQAAILEMLLILRQLAGPQRAGVAQAEVHRQGLEPLALR
ncbi:MAG TPA: hypothetical protein VMK12_22315 [Anaeromyxobacteraceae bacterium]|nr:hypothetical protein [Anaeromyxobacteraceae bacterium]